MWDVCYLESFCFEKHKKMVLDHCQQVLMIWYCIDAMFLSSSPENAIYYKDTGGQWSIIIIVLLFTCV